MPYQQTLSNGPFSSVKNKQRKFKINNLENREKEGGRVINRTEQFIVVQGES
tara:strand:+ start:107 stop:262 length:156 start_codon:yes stop_codon:yes gene_type:complete